METVNGDFEKGAPPPPSPLTGCYLLIVVGEPHSQEHKDIILQRIAKGLLSWNSKDCLVDLEKELTVISEQALEGEEARHGERLIQFASENLVTEILIHPVVSTLVQCMRNLLSSFTRHRHVIHAGYTFAANGSWALQDGTFSYADFSEAFQEIETQRVIHAYENGISLDLHCSPEGDWGRLPKEGFCRGCNVRVNPSDVLTCGSPSITGYIGYISQFLVPTSLEDLLQCSDVVGNIRFSRPTLYVFPGGQGDAALFGINGFNMLLDGGFSRKACFWDFVRHLDRLDAVLMTRLNNSNIGGISSILRRKRKDAVYPQIGHFFCNIQERKTALSPDGDKDRDPLLVDLLDEGQEIISNLRHLNLNPQVCYRDPEPINLYHKVGHGTLNMYVLNPAKDSKEVKEFLQKWNQSDQKLFSKQHREVSFPLQNLISVAVLLIWQPANANDTITRILYPGSSPQHKVFEGLDRVKNLEFIKHPVCSEKSLLAKFGAKKSAKEGVLEKMLPKEKPTEKKDKMIIDNNINAFGSDIKEKQLKKSDTVDSERTRVRKVEDSKIIADNDEKKSKTKTSKVRNDYQQRKKSVEKKDSPTTPKKSIDQAEHRKPLSSTPAKSTKDANNRKVLENKTKSLKSSIEPKPKLEKKIISRKPKTLPKAPVSPAKRVMNGVSRIDSISKKGKIQDGTDSSTVSTPSADQESLKKDISNLTAEEIQQMKADELAELEEEQEAVKEIEEVFRKGETRPNQDESMRKVKSISIDEDKSEKEEYLIIEREDVHVDLVNGKEAKEGEFQKLTRDSEESEKRGQPTSEDKLQKHEDIEEAKDVAQTKEGAVAVSEDTIVTSGEEKVEVLSSDKKSDKEVEVKDIVESQPDEKVSANIKSGDTTTAPTLPEDERIPLDEIKEDNGYPIEEKYAKEETKEKGIPVIQLPPKTFDTIPKIPGVVGIRLDKQSHIRDIVKTPDEVADLPVHEEVDYEYTQESKTDIKTNDVAQENLKRDNESPIAVKEAQVDQEKEEKPEKEDGEEHVKEKLVGKKASEESIEVKHHDIPAVEQTSTTVKITKLPIEKEVSKDIKKEGTKEHEEEEKLETKLIPKTEVQLEDHKPEQDIDVKFKEDQDTGKAMKEAHEKTDTETKEKEEPIEREGIQKCDTQFLEDKESKVKVDAQHKEEQKIEEESPADKEIKDDVEHLPIKTSYEKADIETKKDKLLLESENEKIKPILVQQIQTKKEVHLESEEPEEKQDKLGEFSTDDIEQMPMKETLDKAEKEEKLLPEAKEEKSDSGVIEHVHKSEIPLEDDKSAVEADIKRKEEQKIEEDIPKAKEDVQPLSVKETTSGKVEKEKIIETKYSKEEKDETKQGQKSDTQVKDDESEDETSIKEQKTEEEFPIAKQLKDDVEHLSMRETYEKANKEIKEEKLSIETKEKSEITEITETDKTKTYGIHLERADSKKEISVEEQKIGDVIPTAERVKEEIEHFVKASSDTPRKETKPEKLLSKEDYKDVAYIDKDMDLVEDEPEKERGTKHIVEQDIEQKIPTSTDIKHHVEHFTVKDEFDKPEEEIKKDKIMFETKEAETIESVETKQLQKSETHLEEDESKKDKGIKQNKEQIDVEEKYSVDQTKQTEIKLDIDKDIKTTEDKKEVTEVLQESDKEVVVHKATDIAKKELEDDAVIKELKGDASSLQEDAKIKQSKTLEMKDLEELKDKDETSRDTDVKDTDILKHGEEKEQDNKFELESSVSEEKIDEIKHEQSDTSHEKETSVPDENDKIQLKDEIITELSGTTISTPQKVEGDSKRSSITEDDEVEKDTRQIETEETMPKDREECVIKIVASVAEVLKSDAPLEEFEGKLPISFDTCKPTFISELRETHITTMDDESIDIKSIIISSVPEESSITSTIGDKDSSDSENNELLKKSSDLMATSFISGTADDAEEQGVVQRMLVTASSEDGGEEIEICPVGSIIFSKSSESSGRSSPEKSIESKKSSIVDTISDSVTTVKQISEEHSDKDSDEADVSGVEIHLTSAIDISEKKDTTLSDKISQNHDDLNKDEAFKTEIEPQAVITSTDDKSEICKDEPKSEFIESHSNDEKQKQINGDLDEKRTESKEKVEVEFKSDTDTHISSQNEITKPEEPKGQPTDTTGSSDSKDLSLTPAEIKDFTHASETSTEKILDVDKFKEDSAIKEILSQIDPKPDKLDIRDKYEDLTTDINLKEKDSSIDIKDLPANDIKHAVDKIDEKIESVLDTDTSEDTSKQDDTTKEVEKPDVTDKLKTTGTDVYVKGNVDLPDAKDLSKSISEEPSEEISEIVTEKEIESVADSNKYKDDEATKEGVSKIGIEVEKPHVTDKSESADVCVKVDAEDLLDVKDFPKSKTDLSETKETSDEIRETKTEKKIDSVDSVSDTHKSKEEITIKEVLFKTDGKVEKTDVTDKSQTLGTDVHVEEDLEELSDVKSLAESVSEMSEASDKISESATVKKIESVSHTDKFKKDDATKETFFKTDREVEKTDVAHISKTLSTEVCVKDVEELLDEKGLPTSVTETKEARHAIESVLDTYESKDGTTKEVLFKRDSEVERIDVIENTKTPDPDICVKTDVEELSDVKDLPKSISESRFEEKKPSDKINEIIHEEKIESVSDTDGAKEDRTTEGLLKIDSEVEKSDVIDKSKTLGTDVCVKDVEQLPDEKQSDTISENVTEKKIDSISDKDKFKETKGIKESLFKTDIKAEKTDITESTATTEACVKDDQDLPHVKDLSKSVSETMQPSDEISETEKKTESDLAIHKSKEDSATQDDLSKMDSKVKIPCVTDVSKLLATDKEVIEKDAEVSSDAKDTDKHVVQIEHSFEKDSVTAIEKQQTESLSDTHESKRDSKESKIDSEFGKPDIADKSKTLDTYKDDISAEIKSLSKISSETKQSSDKINNTPAERKTESDLIKHKANEEIKAEKLHAIDKSIDDIASDTSVEEKDAVASTDTKDSRIPVTEKPNSVDKITETVTEKGTVSVDKLSDKLQEDSTSKEDLSKIAHKEEKLHIVDKSEPTDTTEKEVGIELATTKELSKLACEMKESTDKISETINETLFETDLDKSTDKEDIPKIESIDEKLEKFKSTKESDILSEKTSLIDQVSDTISSTLSSDSSTEDKSSTEIKKIPDSILTTSESISSDSGYQKITDLDTETKIDQQQILSKLETSSVVDTKEDEDVKSEDKLSKIDLSHDKLLEDSVHKIDSVEKDVKTSYGMIKEETVTDIKTDTKPPTAISDKVTTQTGLGQVDDKLETEDSGLPKAAISGEKADFDKDISIKKDYHDKVSSSDKSELESIHGQHVKPEETLFGKTDDIKLDSSSFNGYGNQHDELESKGAKDEYEYTSSIDKALTSSIYEKADIGKQEDSDFLKGGKSEQLPPHAETDVLTESQKKVPTTSDHKTQIDVSDVSKTYQEPAKRRSKDSGETSVSGTSTILEQDWDAGALSDRGEDYMKKEVLFTDSYASGGITPPTAPASPGISDSYCTDTKRETDKSSVSDNDNIVCTTSDSTTEDIYTMLRNKKLMTGDGLMTESFYGALPDQTSAGSDETQSERSYLFEVTKAEYVTQYSGDKTDTGHEDEQHLPNTTKDVKCESSSELQKSETDVRTTTRDEEVASSKEDPGKPQGKQLAEIPYSDESTKAKSSSTSLEHGELRTYLYEITKAKDFTKGTDVKGSGKSVASRFASEPFHSTKDDVDPIAPWGKPLGLPSPAPTNDNRGTPKKERKLPLNVSVKNKWNDDKKRSESPSKNKNKKVCPIYVDLTYVPHHGNSYYSYVDFFKTVRARYYVFSGIEPGKEVYNALLEAKQTWDNKDLEVTIIPTYDTDILGYWVSENEELLTKFKIDLSPSASRCTINLQDHETSCSAYRLEF